MEWPTRAVVEEQWQRNHTSRNGNGWTRFVAIGIRAQERTRAHTSIGRMWLTKKAHFSRRAARTMRSTSHHFFRECSLIRTIKWGSKSAAASAAWRDAWWK